jgi:ferritin
MVEQPFVGRLNEQIDHEFSASHQHVAIAVHYDVQTLPRLAGFSTDTPSRSAATP